LREILNADFQVEDVAKRNSGEAMTLCGNRLIYMLTDLCRRQGRSGKKRSSLGEYPVHLQVPLERLEQKQREILLAFKLTVMLNPSL
jgi:hypothetical protein